MSVIDVILLYEDSLLSTSVFTVDISSSFALILRSKGSISSLEKGKVWILVLEVSINNFISYLKKIII